MVGKKQNNVTKRRTTEMSRRRRRLKGNRDSLDISAAILKAMTGKQYLTISEILRQSSLLHWARAGKYFEMLYTFGLLDFHMIKHKKRLSITQKGRAFIRIYDKLTAPFLSFAFLV
jgi:predicted transcriptional regulator